MRVTTPNDSFLPSFLTAFHFSRFGLRARSPIDLHGWASGVHRHLHARCPSLLLCVIYKDSLSRSSIQPFHISCSHSCAGAGVVSLDVGAEEAAASDGIGTPGETTASGAAAAAGAAAANAVRDTTSNAVKADGCVSTTSIVPVPVERVSGGWRLTARSLSIGLEFWRLRGGRRVIIGRDDGSAEGRRFAEDGNAAAALLSIWAESSAMESGGGPSEEPGDVGGFAASLAEHPCEALKATTRRNG